MNNYSTVTEVARRWSVPRYTVLGLCLTRKLRWYWREGRVMFHDSDLRAFLHAHTYWPGDGQTMKTNRFVEWLDERGW